jgi:hypothetical protein
MNQPSSTDSVSSPGGSDAVARRAYELWEKEGRPEGSHVRHWLQAEQEMGVSRSDNSARPAGANPSSARPPSTDTRPMPGTRGAPVPASAAPGRDNKRNSGSPFSGDKSSNANGQNSGKRKPSSAPVM